MEKSKLISTFIAKLKIAFPNYFKDISNNNLIEMIGLYQEMLGNYNENVLNKAIETIIKMKRFMPSISEIIEVCENEKINERNLIIDEMIKDKYFKNEREIEKVYLWISEGIIPKWLQEDMKKYYSKLLENKKILIGN